MMALPIGDEMSATENKLAADVLRKLANEIESGQLELQSYAYGIGGVAGLDQTYTFEVRKVESATQNV